MSAQLKAVCVAVCLCVLAVCGCRKGHTTGVAGDYRYAESTQEAPHVEWTVELTGSGLGKPAVFSFEQLARMEMTRLDNVLMQMTHWPDKTTSWRGPSVDALLTVAQIKPGPMALTLTAADGYEVKSTRADMKSAIVALQDGNGRWLAELDERCPLRLVPPNKTGNYWIRRLARINVEPVADREVSE